MSDQEVADEIKANLHCLFVRTGKTEDDLREQLQANKTTLEEFLKERAQNPAVRKAMVHDRLLLQHYPGELAVSAEEISARYEANLASVYTRPPLVRASHILIGVPADASTEARVNAQAQAWDLVEKARQPDADFALISPLPCLASSAYPSPKLASCLKLCLASRGSTSTLPLFSTSST